MSVVTENWSDRKYKPAESATRAFIVTGVTNEADAIAAVPQVLPGTPFPLDPSLTCGNPSAEYKGPVAWKVTGEFSVNPDTSSGDNPLDRPPKFQWRTAYESAPTDVASDDKALLNSAGFPFANQPTNEFPYRVLVVTRYEVHYNLARAENFENHYNSDTISIPLTPGPVEPGRIILLTYEPLEEYDVRTPYLKVAYTFNLRAGTKKDADNVWDSFKFRLRDEGFSGWYDDSGLFPGKFLYSGEKLEVQEPVLLDGTGKPYNDKFKVSKDKQETPTTPASFQTLAPELLEDTGSAVFLKYKKKKPAAFIGLGLF